MGFTEPGASGKRRGARLITSIRRDVVLNREFWNLAETFAR